MRAESRTVVQGTFGLLALVGGLAGGWYAYQQTSSWWLAAFVFLMASAVVGRGIPDVITDPHKGQRIMFFGIPPTLAVAVVAGAYVLWDRWWLAVVLGFVGYVIGSAISMAAFPAVAADEERDNQARMRAARQASAGTSDPSDMDRHETITALADAAVAQGKLSPSDRPRFVALMQAGQVKEAFELTADVKGSTATGSLGKYSNRKY